jgi:hypothetical protein
VFVAWLELERICGLAISDYESCTDERDYGKDADRPTHLNESCLRDQSASTHWGGRCNSTESTEE